MLRRLLALYDRYAVSRLSVTGAPASLLDVEGNEVGYVDLCELSQGRLRVAGWVNAAKVRLVLAGSEVDMQPRLRREDVAQAKNIKAEVGFDLSLPCAPDTIANSAAPSLTCTPILGCCDIQPLTLNLQRMERARTLLAVQFAGTLLSVTPAIIAWKVTRDPRHRAKVKAGLGLNTTAQAETLMAELFAPDTTPAPRVAQRITIVLPVYNAFDLLEKVLTRIERHTDLPWRLIMIEDCSSDEQVRPFLRDWVSARADSHDIELIENPENRGFIKSVNAGLAKAMSYQGADEGPVILFNSDAFVPADWASRLVQPMQRHDDVASVTPMSNDAEIFSSPVMCAKTALVQGQVDMIDAVARRFHPDAQLSEAPTGVGFCMALSRDWLARVPTLDTAFGRGYGEEVDWCQKIRKLGGRHLGLASLFVEHRGGESFGSAEKRALVAHNNDIVARRYPGYDNEVQRFIHADPMATARLALALAWAGSLDEDVAVPVYLAHSLGGGAEAYLEDQIARTRDLDRPLVILRVGGARRWQIELYAPEGVVLGSTDDTGFMHNLLDILPRRRVLYSCGVGDRDPMGLPEELVALCARPQDQAEMLFHDFFPLSPSYTLLDSDGVYRGTLKDGRNDGAHTVTRTDGTTASLAQWQAAWNVLAQKSTTLEVFSRDSALQVRAVWPDLADRIKQSPHTLSYTPPVFAPPPKGAPVVVGVLGNIGVQKGAAVLQELALAFEQSGQAKLVLVGNIDPAYGLPKSVPLHGSYRPEDIPILAARYGITHWLIPSVWPETFSYTTHETLATGLPVLAFDIGAQGEAVAGADNGVAVPFPTPEAAPQRGQAGNAARNVIETLNALAAAPEGGKTAQALDETVTRTPT